MHPLGAEEWKEELLLLKTRMEPNSNIPMGFIMYNKKDITTIKEGGFLMNIKRHSHESGDLLFGSRES